MTPNRIVAVLTPLVFAPLAGAVAAWVAENLPGVEVSASALEEIFIAGALIALAPAVQWLYGWQKHEAREALATQAAELADASLPAEPSEADFAFEEPDFDEGDEFDEFDFDELDEEAEPVASGG
jgi:hypothetical protein